jgi:hypothetical protein
MKHRCRRTLSRRLAVIVVGTCLAALVAACGGDDSDEQSPAEKAKAAAAKERADARETGLKQCRLLGRKALAQAYGSNDLVRLSRLYADNTYDYLYPYHASLGCLQALREEAGEGSG